MLLPALAPAKSKAYAISCVSNLKQLQLGWQMYANDSQDYMLPNAPYGFAANQSWANAPGGLMDWNNAQGNTNPIPYQQSILAPYMGNQLGVYKCPADNVPSQNGQRIRSYSMQSQVGNLYCKNLTLTVNNPGGTAYVKTTEVANCPGSSQTLIFVEENTCSLLNSVCDGYLQVHSGKGTTADFPDVPGSYHKWSCGMSFADGHSELHKWSTSVLKIPSQANVSKNSILAGPNNADWAWFRDHCSCQ